MSFVLLAALIAAASEPARTDDVIVRADGSLLRGRVISCGKGIRFVPAGAGEVLLNPESVLAVTLASGKPCVLQRYRGDVGAGVALIVLLPALGSVFGGIVGSQACASPCIVGGATAGAAAEVLLESMILFASETASDEIVLPQVPVALATKRPASFSVTLRF